jgi:glycine cleavage system transcriptional repressor
MNNVIVSILGHDRPGIVAAATNVFFECNCNIENVSQTILKTEFAGSFIISMPPDLTQEELRQALNEDLTAMNMHIHIESVLEQKTGWVAGNAEPFVITTKGPDRKGLVASISAIIGRYNVNITNLQAVFKGGDEPGDNIMIYEVDILVDIDRPEFYRALRAKAESLALSISIQHRNIFETINRI